MGKLTVVKGGPPQVPNSAEYKAFDQFARKAQLIAEVYDNLRKVEKQAEDSLKYRSPPYGDALRKIDEALKYDLDNIEETVREVEEFTETFDKTPYDDDDGAEQAYKFEIGRAVAILLGSFPTSNVPDPHVYSRLLIEEIIAAEPCFIEVESTCRRIRRTKKFIPAVSEVLETLEEENKAWAKRNQACWGLKNIAGRLEKLRGALADKKKAEEEARQAEGTNKQRFTRDCWILHAEHGWGEVKGWRGFDVYVEFEKSKLKKLVKGDDLFVPVGQLEVRLGDVVKHYKFGRGVVCELYPENARHVGIRFENDGQATKECLADYLVVLESAQPAGTTMVGKG